MKPRRLASTLRLAAAYAGAGLLTDADPVLAERLASAEAAAAAPMLLYLRASFRKSVGDEAGAAASWRDAAKAPLAGGHQ